jgi:hypothetical protein
MKENYSEDIKDGVYTGLIAAAVAAYYYGFSENVQILSSATVPTFAYIGLSTAVGTTVSQVFVDADEPLLAATVSAICSIGANEIANSPVSPIIVAGVAAPTAFLRQVNKNKN